MNSLKPILAAFLLILTISIPTLAGDIGSPTGPQQPPPPATCSTCDEEQLTASTEPTELGSSDVTYESVQSSELAVEILLALLFVF